MILLTEWSTVSPARQFSVAPEHVVLVVRRDVEPGGVEVGSIVYLTTGPDLSRLFVRETPETVRGYVNTALGTVDVPGPPTPPPAE